MLGRLYVCYPDRTHARLRVRRPERICISGVEVCYLWNAGCRCTPIFFYRFYSVYVLMV